MGTVARRTFGRRALFALTLGASLGALSGCRSARAGSTSAAQPTPALRAAPTVQAAPNTQTAGRSVQQLMVGDVERRYVRYEPPTLDRSTPAPLMLALHGRGGNGRLAEWMFGFNALADAHGFVVAYPDALGDPPTWNEGFVGMAGGPYRPDDIGFVRALVAREQAARPLDPGRLFVCGHSSGAMMTYRLASEASDLFSAAGAVAGSVGYEGPGGAVQTIPQPGRPVSIIHFHGTADTLVPYDGGWRSAGPPGFLPVKDSIAFWVKANSCQSPPSTETVGTARRETYSGGSAGAEVTLWTIDGGGHGWPRVSAGVARRNEPAAGISASELIWTFFAGHGRSG